MSYYIYENWRAGPHKAVIHNGSCGHCNNGSGRAGGYDPKNAEWHGPYETLALVRSAQKGLSVKVLEECGVCLRGVV